VTHLITVVFSCQRSPWRWPYYWPKRVGEDIIKTHKKLKCICWLV